MTGRSFLKQAFFVIFFINLFASCQKQVPENVGSEVEVKNLEVYNSLTLKSGALLGLPVRLKMNHETGHLFVQDMANWAVIELNEKGEEIRGYGKQGRGPGEIQNLEDFFLNKDHLFIVDGGQFLIHKYSLKNGQFMSSFDYRAFMMERKNRLKNGVLLPPSAPMNDNYNRPFVTLNETVLLPYQNSCEFLYEAINWQGEKLADIGEVPEGFKRSQGGEYIRDALQNKEVPDRDSALVFPVNVRSDSNEIYLVYSAIPKITKYRLSGEKLWEKPISYTPEVDSLIIDLSNVLKEDPTRSLSQLPVKKYMAGRSDTKGYLYLATYTNMDTPSTPRRPMWIHQFDTEGILVHRYKIIADADQYFYPAINFEKREIFTPSFNKGDVRVYKF